MKNMIRMMVCVALLCAANVRAEEPTYPIDEKSIACMDRNPSTQGMLVCLQQAYAEWDGELNKVYADVRLRLNPQAQAALKESQKRWIAYRDAEFLAIDLIYGGMQGTMWRVAGFGQKVEFVKRRTVELLTYANDLAQTN